MNTEEIKQWGLLLLDTILEVVKEKNGNGKISKDDFYKMLARENASIKSWRDKYRSTMLGDERAYSRTIYKDVSSALRKRIGLDEEYADFDKPILVGNITENDIKSYLQCVNRSEPSNRSGNRIWNNNDDEKFAKAFKESLKEHINNEIEGIGKPSPVRKIAFYFQNKEVYEKKEAWEYDKQIKGFIDEYEKNKYKLQYISEEILKDHAKKLIEMANDMNAVIRYKKLVQTRVQK